MTADPQVPADGVNDPNRVWSGATTFHVVMDDVGAGASSAVSVPAMVDVQYIDNLVFLVDAVADPVLASSGTMLAFEGGAELRADSSGILRKRAKDELGAGGGDGLGQVP
jgi:hypothetical protein